MTLIPALVLALLQGLTEFLPVSSSGHLVLAQSMLPTTGPNELLYDVMLHVATALAIVVYFREDLLGVLRGLFGGRGGGYFAGSERRLVAYGIVATVPTAIIGLGIQRYLEEAVTRVDVVGLMLLVTGGMLWTGRRPAAGRSFAEMRAVDALVIGVLQGFAVLPGISRSGSTIVGGVWRGLDRELAARFSLLISLPAIGGAALLKGLDAATEPLPPLGPFLAGMALASVVGYVAIGWILRLVRDDLFHRFAFYLWPLGGLAILWYYLV